MAIREGAWDCPVCGRKRNRGPDKFCGGCGSPRGPEVQFYLPDDAPEVTEAEALKRAAAGPDWICPYCDADNPAVNAFCSGCGAPRDAAKTREVVEQRFDAPAAPPSPQPLAAPPPAERRSSRLKKGFGLGCLGLVALIALVVFLGRPKSTTLTVTGFHWLRTIAVEELRPVTEQAWEGEVPGGARILGRSREVHHVDHIQIGTETRTRTVSERVQTGTERVKVGTRDLGNGYFEDVYEDRPIYETVRARRPTRSRSTATSPSTGSASATRSRNGMPDREARAEGQDHVARLARSPARSRGASGEARGALRGVFPDRRGEARHLQGAERGGLERFRGGADLQGEGLWEWEGGGGGGGRLRGSAEFRPAGGGPAHRAPPPYAASSSISRSPRLGNIRRTSAPRSPSPAGRRSSE